jgi:CheY-like chemotaxis protein/anti-sigma regulatory factor (Ser/Thr protein kinase)
LRDLSIVYRNANHLQSLVNDVLDLARIESAQMTIKLEWTTLTDLLAEMTQTARSLVEKRHLTFEVNVQESLPQVMIDPIRVRQILFNLLSNAVRFTDQGKISLIVEERDNALQFHVRDTGIGIRSEDQKHIFAPFRQANGGLNQRGGAGLGLTISQQLAQLHGGDIRVESVFGKGSTFTFHLPLQQAAPLSQRNSDVAAIASRIDPKNQLALVVTQSPTATAMFTRHLSDYRVINATSFEQAKTLATQLLPQLVVIDSFMRSMEAETLHELAQDWQLFNAYMIACPLPGEDALRQQLNAQAYMMKPVARERLEDVLQQFGDDIRRILIVDNDRDFVQLIERMLHNPLRKFDLISTYGGKEALDWLKSNPSPDLILLDLEMPDMNGQEVLRHLRTLPNGEQLKVVIVSALEILPTATQVSGNLTVTRPAGATTTDLLKWIHGVVRG